MSDYETLGAIKAVCKMDWPASAVLLSIMRILACHPGNPWGRCVHCGASGPAVALDAGSTVGLFCPKSDRHVFAIEEARPPATDAPE